MPVRKVKHLLYCDVGRRIIWPGSPAYKVDGLLCCEECLQVALLHPLPTVP